MVGRGRAGRMQRMWIGAVAAGACLLAGPSIASAADITVNDDTTGPGPVGATCATPDHATITAALSAAAASGDRILVCAGTYTQSQILINKSVDLIGTPGGLSIIDGGNATNLPSGGLIRTDAAATGDILVEDFTVRNAGSQNPGGTQYSILLKGNTFGLSQDFNRVDVLGRGAGGTDYGLDADNVDADVTFRNGSITDTDFNPVLLEQGNGAQTLRDSTISQNGATSTSAIFVVNYSGDNTTNPLRIVGNDVDANGRGGISIQTGFPAAGIPAPATRNSVEVSGNSITDFTGFGMSVLNNDPAANGLAGRISNVGINFNEITPRAGASTGIRVQGLVSNVGMTSNNLFGLATNGIAINNATAGHGPVAVDAHFNRIISAAGGLTSAAAEQVSADRNWWGCNEGPTNTADCSDVTGNVDFDPWLVLGLAASPTSIQAAGGSSNLTADLTNDSNGDPAGPGFPDGTEVAFGTTLGSVGTPRNTADGIAESVLTAGANDGTATVNADLDGESVTTPVTITAAPTPPNPPVADSPPVVSFSLPKTIKSGKRGLLTATVSDDKGIKFVDFFVGDKNICQVAVAPYECNFRPRRMRGRIGLSAVVTDTAGQTGVALGTTRVVKKRKNQIGK